VKPRPASEVPRVALTLEESALALGVSLAHLRRHVLPELRVIRSGSVRLVPVAELAKWADRAATLAGGSTMPAPTKRPRAAETAGGMAHEEKAS